jgi:glutathione S-transferase
MGDVFVWHFYYQLVVRRRVWKEEPDAEIVRAATEDEIPGVLDYLEGEVPPEGWSFERLCVADVALASFFRNAAFAGFSIDAQRWPRAAGFVARVLATPEFAALAAFEDITMRTPIPQRDAALRAAGAPLTESTLAIASPRHGMMGI